MKKLLVIYAGLFLILIGLALVIFNYSPSEEGSAGNNENSINLGDQSQNNPSVVTLESVALSKSGFVVIHEADGSKTGKVVAVSPFLASGENKLVFVPASLESGKVYYATLHADNGDGIFNETDDGMVEVRGKEIRVRFTAGG